MNQIQKTAIFVAVAAGLSWVTWVTRPTFSTLTAKDMIGQELFPKFVDPLAATSLELVKYDESAVQPVTFKVAQAGGGPWSIPSHQDYPADAEKQLAEAAAGLMHLKVIDIPVSPEATAGAKSDGQSGVRAEHEQYGVVDPSGKNLPSDAGKIGTRVTMRDKKDDVLLSLVVGKQVPDRPGLYYVRRAEQDPVYIVGAKTDKLSTKFEDWIEKDVLKLSSWDIRRIDIEDYTFDAAAGSIDPRGQLSLEYSDTGDPRWKMVRDEVFSRAKRGWAEQKLGANEELNTTTLDDLKNAVDDLKIVDVARKPKGLSTNLKLEGNLKLDPEAQDSLESRGFYLVPLADPSNPARTVVQVISNQGQFSVLTKEGVRYVLRFGQIAGSSTNQAQAKPTEGQQDAAAEKDASSESVNRYLFVMAEFDPSPLEKPVLEKLPEEKPEEAKKDEAAKAEAGKEGEKKSEADKKAEADQKAADLKAERERIEKANKQKEDEYNQKLKDGEKKVQELNGRFADWYFVISEDVYKKIHLGRKDMVKEKEKTEEEKKAEEAKKSEAAKPEGSVQDFESLKSEAPKDDATTAKPKEEAPQAEAPKTEPKAEAPKNDATKSESAKPKAPEAKQPKAESSEKKAANKKARSEPGAPKDENEKAETPKEK